ncbi:hypothetical protein K4F52_000134 [Lecanicillium sp. MT-2017a]|nr:hypothetical protein K4F52_000134 [Lecanicillium sp. MT-2017a]
MKFSKNFAPFGIALVFGQKAAGLNLTFSGKECPSPSRNTSIDFSSVPYFNATSVTKFSVQQLGPHITEPWYYILTFSDGRGSGSSLIDRWVSVPKSFWDSQAANNTPVCPITLPGIKKSPKGKEGNETCQGVVTDECNGAFADVEDFTVDDACRVESLPGVDLPNDYMTVKIVSEGYGDDINATVYDHYDATLRESIATFFLIGTDGNRKQLVQSVCSVPDDVQKDSRTVEDGRKDGVEDYENGDEDSLGASLGAGQPTVIVAAIACLVGAAIL